MKEPKTCLDCSGQMDARSARCRVCFRGKLPTCVDCGKQLGRDGQKQCRPCWMKQHMAKTSRPRCIDCGKSFSWMVGRPGARQRPKRCWECEVKRRRRERIIVQQERQRAVRGDLRNAETKTNRHRRWNAIPLRRLLSPLPCAVCAYEKLPSR